MYSYYVRPNCNLTPGDLSRKTILRHLQNQAPEGSNLVDRLTLSQAPTVDGVVKDLSRLGQACNRRMEGREMAGQALKILGVMGGVAAACLLPLGAAAVGVAAATGLFTVGHKFPRSESQTQDRHEWIIANKQVKDVCAAASLCYDRAAFFDANPDGSHSPLFRSPDGLTADPRHSAPAWRF